MAIRKIGQIFVDMGFIDDEQLTQLLEEQQQNPGELLGKIAEEMGLVTSEQIAQALAEQMGLRVINLNEQAVEKEVLLKIDETMAMMYRVVPVQFEDEVLTIATAHPEDLSVQDELRTFLGVDIRIVVASERDIAQALENYYAEKEESFEKVVEGLANDESLRKLAEDSANKHDIAGEAALADSVPVRKLINMVLLMAIKDHASDVHFEPFEDEFRVRIKADGVLYELVPPPLHLAFAVTTRVKVMANLDIAERRLPQDGRIELNVGGHPVDLRVSVLPTMFGESVVMRLLDRSVVSLDLEKVGMNEFTLGEFRTVMNKPNGIILVTGPTGSGKTTTLYSALSELNDICDKLITTEDPVEYDIDGIVQIAIDAEIGNTFAHCLRSILRQDPDKILVGEIRDVETAEIAVQAALTGHLVFSTLHTNDAPSTITRMKDMGVPTFLITATLEAILAQRLVRRICSECREQVDPPEDLLYDLGLTLEEAKEKEFFHGAGCSACNGTGYHGRVGLFELMILTDALRDQIMRNASTDEMREEARANGMITLRDAGMKQVYEGTTTVEEIVRETILEA